jgi:hypothetical protein
MPAEEQLSQCIAYKTIVLDPSSLGSGGGAVATSKKNNRESAQGWV